MVGGIIKQVHIFFHSLVFILNMINLVSITNYRPIKVLEEVKTIREEMKLLNWMDEVYGAIITLN